MSLDVLNDFSRILLCDTEYVARDGERVVPVSLSALELHSGKRWQMFFDDAQAHYDNPLPFDDDTLFVAHATHAEFSTFLALGWELPQWVLDTYVEARAATNGTRKPDGSAYACGLIEVLTLYGLDSMTVVEKQEMRDLILRGHPYTAEERQAILDYNWQDVEALDRLLPALLRTVDLSAAIHRGRYMKAVARMEDTGIPIDMAAYQRLRNSWEELKVRIAMDVEREHGYGVYEIGRDKKAHFKSGKFEALIEREGLSHLWPRTPSGRLATDDNEVFQPMCRRYPQLEPLRQVRTTLSGFRAFSLAVGSDCRNRAPLMPFGTLTGRNAPKASKFAFGPSAWIRSVIRPKEGCALAYLDYASAEFGEAAALSYDINMK